MSTGTIQELGEDDCRELLGVGRFARVAFRRDGRLELLPVNYAYDAGIILIRTTAHSGLATIVGNEFVLEADHHDDTYQTGWSVTVRGTAQLASQEQIDSFGSRMPNSWAGGDDPIHVAISADELSGRRARAFPA
ncbi:pyridoxamine 5'-phosphate oxidase family protein [Aeromicrobium sp. 179-A 4D2 NHS]|uniref:pyridoxamine 5'-phosphate oxidase family protein n=1 Tax=Aeromicrobium sp. 179-A 4D2 NHS TaxID=3142375 RepID=UPI00399F1CF4